jgi:hypothetical protein
MISRKKGDPCPDCSGTGWTCANCGDDGLDCACPEEEREAMDCQSCEGTAVNDDEEGDTNDRFVEDDPEE